MSKFEPALIILRNWMSKSSRVIALSGRPPIALKFDGKIGAVLEDGFSLLSGESFMLVDLSDSLMSSYEESVEMSEPLKSAIPIEWDSSLHFSYREGPALTLFSVPPQQY